MANFDEDIKRITNTMLEDGTVEDIISKKIAKSFEEAIDSAFRWGDLKKTIEKRITEILVPYIENYDMSKYIVKLDTILSEIIEQTALSENKKLLENFKHLMLEPTVKTVTLSDMFEEYKKFVAAEMDTAARDIDFDNGEPEYIPMDVRCYFEKEEERIWSSFDWASIEFGVEEKDQEETLNRTIKLTHYKNDKDKAYGFTYETNVPVDRLKYLSDFDIYLLTLSRANVKIVIDKEDIMDEVYSNTKPELSYS